MLLLRLGHGFLPQFGELCECSQHSSNETVHNHTAQHMALHFMLWHIERALPLQRA